jgi:hypothetical protein
MANPKTDRDPVTGEASEPARGYAFAIGLPQSDDDHVVAMLRAAGSPVTRQNWIDLAYGADVPEPWTPEHESELPEALQDWAQVVITD